VVAIDGLDELGGDAKGVADLSHTTLEDEADPELAAELGNAYLRTIDRRLLVFGGGAARDDGETDDGSELGYDILGEAIGESGLLGITAEIGEAQDRDRGTVRTGERCFARQPRP
jgi:hypothetical protein